MTVQQRGDKALLVNAHSNGLTNGRILDDGACHVHGGKERAGGLDAGELIIAVFKVRICFIRHAVSCVNIAGLQSRREGIAVGKRADGQLVDFRRTVPVIFVLCQRQMIVRDHICYDIRTCAGDNAGIKIAGIHVNDATVRVAQIVHKCRVRLAGGDGQDLTVRLHVGNFGVAGCAVVVFQQMLKALLYGFRVHLSPAGERNIVLKRDRPREVSVVFP